MIRLGICDDDPEAREFLQMVLARDPDFCIDTVCSDGEEALAFRGSVDIWLMDLRMPGMGGRRTCEALLSRNPRQKILFLTSFPEESVEECLRAGASGYLFKDERPTSIVGAIKAVAAGLGVGSRSAVASLVDRDAAARPAASGLVVDEDDEELLRLVLAGDSNHSMAKALHLSDSGLKKRLNRLMQRAGVTSRPMLMAKVYASLR